MQKTGKFNHQRKDRELIVAISVFLLGREELKSLFWNIKSVNYNHTTQSVNIGISTVDNKLGTVLEKLRKTCRDLSLYLYERGLTFKKTRINFVVDQTEKEIQKIYSVLNKLEITK